jgi:hypothetical protein
MATKKKEKPHELISSSMFKAIGTTIGLAIAGALVAWLTGFFDPEGSTGPVQTDTEQYDGPRNLGKRK